MKRTFLLLTIFSILFCSCNKKETILPTIINSGDYIKGEVLAVITTENEYFDSVPIIYNNEGNVIICKDLNRKVALQTIIGVKSILYYNVFLCSGIENKNALRSFCIIYQTETSRMLSIFNVIEETKNTFKIENFITERTEADRVLFKNITDMNSKYLYILHTDSEKALYIDINYRIVKSIDITTKYVFKDHYNLDTEIVATDGKNLVFIKPVNFEVSTVLPIVDERKNIKFTYKGCNTYVKSCFYDDTLIFFNPYWHEITNKIRLPFNPKKDEDNVFIYENETYWLNNKLFKISELKYQASIYLYKYRPLKYNLYVLYTNENNSFKSSLFSFDNLNNDEYDLKYINIEDINDIIKNVTFGVFNNENRLYYYSETAIYYIILSETKYKPEIEEVLINNR